VGGDGKQIQRLLMQTSDQASRSSVFQVAQKNKGLKEVVEALVDMSQEPEEQAIAIA